VERVVRKFDTFEEAEAAEREYYRGLTPDERIAIMLDLIFPEGTDAASARLERVCRIIKLGAS
jgi:hypothetical protein